MHLALALARVLALGASTAMAAPAGASPPQPAKHEDLPLPVFAGAARKALPPVEQCVSSHVDLTAVGTYQFHAQVLLNLEGGVRFVYLSFDEGRPLALDDCVVEAIRKSVAVEVPPSSQLPYRILSWFSIGAPSTMETPHAEPVFTAIGSGIPVPRGDQLLTREPSADERNWLFDTSGITYLTQRVLLGDLAPSEVEGRLESSREALAACGVTAPDDHEFIRHGAVFGATLERDGSLVRPSVGGPVDAGLKDCVLGVFRSWSFEPHSSTTLLNIPLAVTTKVRESSESSESDTPIGE